MTTQDSPSWSIATKSIVAVTLLIFGIVIIWRFQDLINPLLIAGILAYLLNPAVQQLQNLFKGRRTPAVLVVYLLLLLLFAGASTVLGIVAVEQVTKLEQLLPDSFNEAIDLAVDQIELITKREYILGPFTFSIRSLLGGTTDLRAMARQAASFLQPLFSTSSTLAVQAASATVSTVSNLFLIFAVSIYLSKDSREFGEQMVKLAGHAGYADDASRLLRDFTRIWNAYLRGQVILGLVMGAAVWFCLFALGVNNALGLGILSGALEFLPIVGPLIGAIAAILVAFFQDSNWLAMSGFNYALTVAIVMILLQQLENNLLVPRIVGDALDLHPLLVMISVIMGVSLAGILGAVLSAPTVATMKLIGSYAWRKLFDLPPFPTPEPEEHLPQSKTRLATAWWLRSQRRLQQWVSPPIHKNDPKPNKQEIQHSKQNNKQIQNPKSKIQN